MKTQALSLGLYVHVPFCSHQCAYCHFFKRPLTPDRLQQFLSKIELESQFWHQRCGDRCPDTIFWGGGSPSCLSPEQLYQLGQWCIFPIPPKEWTVEVSPSTLTPEKLDALKALGVTRLSMGVQSFQPKILQTLGRQYSVQSALESYEMMRNQGFNNINLDLIFAPEHTTWADWEKDLTQALTLHPEHLSTYCLTYESESGPFMPEKHRSIDTEREAFFYEHTWQFLEAHGYLHYEVSNFSLPQFECLHNCNTWRMQEWVGWGPSAASQYGMKRFQNYDALDKWQLNHYKNEIALTEEMLCQDALIFGLRMREGIHMPTLQQRFPQVDLQFYQPLWDVFIQEGWLSFEHQQLCCTPKGLLLADSLAVEILSYAEKL